MTSTVPPFTFEGLRRRSNQELIELWCTLDPIRKVEYGLYLGVIRTNTITDYYGPVNPNTGRSAPHP